MADTGMVPQSFTSTVSGTGNSIFFTTNAVSPTGRYFRVQSTNLSTSALTSVITLPNGARFNPQQNYRAPRALGNYQFKAFYFAFDSDSDLYLESIYEDIYDTVGLQGTLVVTRRADGGATTVEATAVLKAIAASWSGRKYDYSVADGLQLQHLEIDYTFELMKDWS